MAKETKKKIFQTFWSLIDNHSLDEITVTMLVQECGISRQTFYYHFSDIESLLRWGIEQSTSGCVKRAKQASNMREATVIFLSMLQDGSDVISKLLKSSYGGYTTLLIKDSIAQYIAKFAVRYADESVVNSPNAEFLLDFISNGITGGVIAAFIEQKAIDVEIIADKLNTLVFEKFIVE